jgi:crotonobetaine/carnitine-CoA ligase
VDSGAHDFPTRAEAVLPDLLERHATESPDRVLAVFDDGDEWSYGATATRTWQLANGLIELGLRQDEPVLSCLPNGKEALLSWLATATAGGVYSPIHHALRGQFFEHAVNLVGASRMIIHAKLMDRLEGLNLPTLKQLIVVDDDGSASTAGGRGMIRWEDVPSSNSFRPVLANQLEPWSTASVLFTSGTTGPSKAVRRTYALCLAMAKLTLDPIGINKDDRFYMCLPMAHGGADSVIYAMIRAGGSLCIVSGFRTATFLDDVRRWRCTYAQVFSAMSVFLAKSPERPDDHDNPLRWMMLAPMFPEIDDFAKRFGVRLHSLYGMTEVPCPFNVIDPVDYRSVGMPNLTDYDIRLVDENDCEVTPGTPGEMIVQHRWPWAVVPEYWGMPEASATAWRNGWFHTGDLLIQDESGRYTIADRRKDSIRRRGENVSSQEVEALLTAEPEVLDSAVIGVPGEIDEEVMAVLVLRPGSTLDLKNFIVRVADRMPYYAVPRYLEIVDELPRGTTLRVDKKALRTKGVTESTWDRESAGIKIRRDQL